MNWVFVGNPEIMSLYATLFSSHFAQKKTFISSVMDKLRTPNM